MPGLGRYPCSSCNYVARNSRMLARHAVLLHSDKVYKCPVCPFITRYAANWYRHKRDLHRLTKMSNCEVCGFFASSTAELAHHKETLHPETLGLDRFENKYARERLRLCGGSIVPEADNKPLEEKAKRSSKAGSSNATLVELLSTYPNKITETADQDSGIVVDSEAEGTVEAQSDTHKVESNDNLDISADFHVEAVYQDEDTAGEESESITFSLPSNGFLNLCDESDNVELQTKSVQAVLEDKNLSADDVPLNGKSPTSAPAQYNHTPDGLGPVRVRRTYTCEPCDLSTSNPREYLTHLRDIHKQQIKIHECKYCIYASKHIQKLTRHCKLVHAKLIADDPEFQKRLELSKERKHKLAMFRVNTDNNQQFATHQLNAGSSSQFAVRKAPARTLSQEIFKCVVCSYQTRNRSLFFHHERTAHSKKRVYRCTQCPYVTNDRARHTKHVKYHNFPKLKCEFCFFKTAYKWNMDRHMKNHEEGAKGEFHCSSCNFTTATKQSYKSHITNHHNPLALNEEMDEDFSFEREVDEENESWEEIDDEDEVSMNLNGFDESSGLSQMDNTIDDTLEDSNDIEQLLKCRYCDYQTTWLFQLKKHEEGHRCLKKHPCPLCGTRFEHLAWLTKHLRRVHPENSQAKNIAAAFDLMKPDKRKPGNDYVSDTILPMFQEALQQNIPINKSTAQVMRSAPSPINTKNSMLSTLLSKPTTYPSNMFPKFNQGFRRVLPTIAPKPQPQMLNLQSKIVPNNAGAQVDRPKQYPSCNACNYRTRWSSELERHKRVHSPDKPFSCPKCKYRCKWSGDMSRHLAKYHGIKVATPRKLGFIRPKPNIWDATGKPTRKDLFNLSSPLQQTPKQGNLSSLNMFSSDSNGDEYDFLDNDQDTSKNENNSHYKSPLQYLQETTQQLPDTSQKSAAAKRKYQCPFCIFTTTTASRFHLHMVQHYNKRPYMCSVCNLSSNWEWDITKHIRIKAEKDKLHGKATVLLVDESGRRNYEKYDKYLVDSNASPPTSFPATPEQMEPEFKPVVNQQGSSSTANTENSAKNCSYDFRSIGSNFEPVPESIVVTPDINLGFSSEGGDSATESPQKQTGSANVASRNENDSRFYFCKHCDFKHFTKRVVVSHLSFHAGIKPFRCRSCDIASNWRHVIVKHVKDEHNGDISKVEERIKFAQDGNVLRLATNDNTNSTKTNSSFFNCTICPYKCDREYYMKSHMRHHTSYPGAEFRCDYCPFYVKLEATLFRHMRVHGVSSFPEKEILDSPTSDSFEDSSQSEMVPNIYLSDDLQQQESTEDSIAISFDALSQFRDPVPFKDTTVISPQKAKRHLCELCPYKTDSKTQYLYHKQYHRANASAPFKCTICSYWATKQHLLRQHTKMHEKADSEAETTTPNKQSAPDASPQKAVMDLGQEADLSSSLTVVYVKRDNHVIKMYKCNFCPMMNRKRSNVRIHLKMHGVVINDGKYACSYCNYQCLNQGGLTNHLKIHQKEPEETVTEASKLDLVLQNSEPAPQFCPDCPAMFKTFNELQMHCRFHDSANPVSCTYCSYRTKTKSHLIKHNIVHTAKYESKRISSQGPPFASVSVTQGDNPPMVKKFDQFLLWEAIEVKTAQSRKGIAKDLLHHCTLCPATFIKTATLNYHIALHNSGGIYRCNQCDYAVNRMENLSVHGTLHPKKLSKPKRLPSTSYPCPKCPAVFYKQDRFDRHLALHGKGYKFSCEYCDYSVKFAANLPKHKLLHLAKMSVDGSPVKAEASAASFAPEASPQPTLETSNIHAESEDRMYICDRCPYAMPRKDAVQSHQRRHWLKDGFKCPFCDYTSLQSNFLPSHIRLHTQGSRLFPPQAFMKFENFKVVMKEKDGAETVIFDDEWIPDPKATTSSKKAKRTSKNTADSSDASSSTKVPVVVLSNFYESDKEMREWAPQLKIPKLKISKSIAAREKFSKIYVSKKKTERNKPSLVVKISKLETKENDKVIYSISTKTPEVVNLYTDDAICDEADVNDPISEPNNSEEGRAVECSVQVIDLVNDRESDKIDDDVETVPLKKVLDSCENANNNSSENTNNNLSLPDRDISTETSAET